MELTEHDLTVMYREYIQAKIRYNLGRLAIEEIPTFTVHTDNDLFIDVKNGGHRVVLRTYGQPVAFTTFADKVEFHDTNVEFVTYEGQYYHSFRIYYDSVKGVIPVE